MLKKMTWMESECQLSSTFDKLYFEIENKKPAPWADMKAVF